MIVQCDQCNAKFRLDDAKVKEEGVKVRCSKCKHVFVVRKEVPSEEPDFDSILSGLESSPSENRAAAATASQSLGELAVTAQQKAADDAPGDEWDMNFAEAAQGIAADQGGAAPSGTEMEWQTEVSGGEKASEERHEPAAAGTELNVDEDSGDLSHLFSSEEKIEGKSGEFDLGEFDFGDDAFEQTGGPVDSISEERTVHSVDETVVGEKGGKEESFSSFDEFSSTIYMDAGEKKPSGQETEEFSLADPFAVGDWKDAVATGSEGESPVAPAVKEEASASDEFFSFAESAPKEKAGETFDFGSTDFAKTLAATNVEQKNEPIWGYTADEAESEADGVEKSDAVPPPALFSVEDEEALPTSIVTTRRKGGRVVGLVLGSLGVILALLLVGGGYYYFAKGPAAFEGLGLGAVSKWFGKESPEEGKIAVASPVGAFLVNQEAGEIFVVTGDAVNGFKKPRATIQIKVTLYGPKGVASQQKTVYAGNALSREQLATLPFAKIEAAMNNQFGDSLANLGVQPGKSIPFVVVFDKVPKDVAEFGVEAVGSTVASQ